jgi:hypothetical protein
MSLSLLVGCHQYLEPDQCPVQTRFALIQLECILRGSEKSLDSPHLHLCADVGLDFLECPAKTEFMKSTCQQN